jgi:hypothetical protein
VKGQIVNILKKLLVSGTCLALPHVAMADPAWFQVPQMTVWTGVSTLGTGGTIGFHNPHDLVGMRFNANFFRLGINFTQSQAHSRAQAQFQNESVYADIYPWHKNFHFTIGVVFNQNSANYSSTPEITGALLGFILNSNYTGAIGNVHGPISFNPVAPYFGFGYNVNTGKHWTVTFDAGAIYQGNGRIALIPTGLLATFPQFNQQILANGYKADKMIDKMSFYPVISFQVGYRF